MARRAQAVEHVWVRDVVAVGVLDQNACLHQRRDVDAGLFRQAVGADRLSLSRKRTRARAGVRSRWLALARGWRATCSIAASWASLAGRMESILRRGTW